MSLDSSPDIRSMDCEDSRMMCFGQKSQLQVVSRWFVNLLRGLLVVAIGAVAFAGPVAAQEDLTFKIYCARCHGDAGHGDGSDGATLKAHPRNFTDCATMAKISDPTMFKAIKEGGASVGLSDEMPAWGSSLGDDDIHSLMKFIRHFCHK